MNTNFVIYLYQSDIDEFNTSISDIQNGFTYLWEGENVIHLRLRPVRHGFGKKEPCLFTKQYAKCGQWQLLSIDNTILAYAPYSSEGIEVNLIPTKNDLYSRSKGILEVDILHQRHVAIIGLGSFGSQIAIELAKAGVGEFSLVDFDRVELHNLARHTCVLNDLGRLKTDAIEDAILGKNPYARVNKYPIDINEHFRMINSIITEADLIICATDNNRSRYTLAELTHRHEKVCIYGRAITRAEGGDVFISRPGNACYCCLVGNEWFEANSEEISNETSARQNGTIPAYASADDVEAMVQVGLSSDIAPLCNMMIKLSLIELSRGETSGISCLESELTYNYFMWANRRERKYSNWSAFPNAGPRPTIMRWYGANIQKQNSCAICSNETTLELGDEFETQLSEVDMSDVNINDLINLQTNL